MTTNASAKYIGIIALWLVLVLGWAQASHAGIIVCGKGYSNGVAPTGRFIGSGIGLTLNLTVNGDGAIVNSSVAVAGQGYAVGDVGAVNGGNPVIGYQVDSVSNNDPNVLNGAVLRFHLIPLQLDLRNTAPALPDENPDSKFQQRVDAFNQFAMCQSLPLPNNCGHPDLGESFQTWMFPRLASSDPARRQEVIDYLRNLKRSDLGQMGTDTSTDCPGGVSLKGLLDDLKEFFTNAARRGDGDAAMIGLITVLYKYQSILPSDVQDNILSLIDQTPGPGSVESLSFGAKASTGVTVCTLACAGAGLGLPVCLAACAITVAEARVVVPETENHLNMIYASQYLANQFRFQKTGNAQFDNARIGYRALLLNRLKDFVRNDFIEYNAHPYQDYDMFPLLALASFAADPPVKAAAKMVLDYLAAKVAVSSNDARRSTPFRRRDEVPKHNCAELIADCADPATAWYTMLTGATDFLQTDHPADPTPFLPKDFAPGNYSAAWGWAANTDYRIDPSIIDLFVNRKHRNFYQFFHYSRTLRTDGFKDSNDELYFGSPSYLIVAGGHTTHYAYTADLPFPLNLIPLISPGDDTDKGVAVPTYLMPTGDKHSRDTMIQFDAGLCVAPNFACGFNPKYADANMPDPTPKQGVAGTWHFADKHGDGDKPGYYVAVYTQDNFGFFEVYDTWTNPKGLANIQAFIQKVHQNNDARTFSSTANNTYTTVMGDVIEFSFDPHILSINGHPPYDPNRTNGTIINNDGNGTVTITNPAKGTTLTLDATQPPNHPTITVPGPVQFPNTCVGSKSFTTMNVCNGGNDTLFVYNILSLSDTQFQVTEPSSGYPTTIGPNFCFPFQASFAPKIPAAISAKLTISNSDDSVPELKVTASGTGIQQAIAALIANGGNFGNVCTGARTDLNLTINNTGGCALVISNITSSSPEFIVAGTLSYPFIIQAGDSLQVPIRFAPTSLGAKSANITVTSNDPVQPSKVIPVSGNTPPGKIAVTGSGTFGNVCAATNAQQPITIANVGACNLNVSSVTVDNGLGGQCADFTIRNNPFPNTLSHDSSLPVTEAFTPTSGGSKSCRLVIASDDPTAPVVTVPLTATTPPVILDVPNGGYTFPATVVQSIGACSSKVPFPVSNKGLCPVTINSVAVGGTNGADYSLAGLPALTTPLQSGHVLGEGNLNVVFKPTASPLTRHETGTLTVTYEDDPITHHQTSTTQNVCGEDAQTGVRLLVTAGGVPLATVDKIQLHRLTSNRQGISNDNATNVPLQPAVTQASPCASFKYHREWGGASNPVQLTAGDYQISVSATVPSTGRKDSKTVSFSLDTCSFNQNLVVDF
jgi:hypothetical protein